MRKTGQYEPCTICGTGVYRAAWQRRKRPRPFCSRQCYEVWWKAAFPVYAVGAESPGWRGGKITKACIQCGQFFEIWPRRERTAKFCNKTCYGAYNSGNRNHLWRGGISSERDTAKATKAYAEWRIAVYRRDHFTCVLCLKHCKNLHAHHIKRFSDYPEFRFDVENGATMCGPCHKQTCKLEGYFENLLRSRILRDVTSDTRVPLDIVKIKSDLHGDMQRLAEMTSPAESETIQ